MLLRSVCYSAAQRAVLGLLIDRFPDEIYFYLQIGNFFLKIRKKGGYFGLGMGPYFGP